MHELISINGESGRLSAMVDQLHKELEYLKDFRGDTAELVRCTIRSLIRQYSNRIEALAAQRREIIGSLSTLPEKQRKVLLLHYDCGMSWTEVSRAMGYSLRYIYRIAKG